MGSMRGMQLQISANGVENFLPPVQVPRETENGYTVDKPSWVRESSHAEMLFELGSDRSWKCSQSGLSLIGRNENSTIVVENLLVSRCHAAILHHISGQTYVVDLGSAHGTFIGKRLLIPYTPTRLPEGALIRLGLHGGQFVLKRYLPVEVALSSSAVQERFYTEEGDAGEDADDMQINTVLNQALSCPGVTCNMDIYRQFEAVRLAKLGLSSHQLREELHRSQTLDSEGLMKYQSSGHLVNNNRSISGCSSSTCSPQNSWQSLTDESATSSDSSVDGVGSNCTRAGAPRRRSDSCGIPVELKRVRFDAPSVCTPSGENSHTGSS